MSTEKIIFKDFTEYWFYVKNLSKEQRDTIFNSLSGNQQKTLREYYQTGGWEDLFMRNTLDKMLDDLVKNYNIDLLSIKIKVLSGKSQTVDASKWAFVIDLFKDFDNKHTSYIFGGVDIEPLDDSRLMLKRREIA